MANYLINTKVNPFPLVIGGVTYLVNTKVNPFPLVIGGVTYLVNTKVNPFSLTIANAAPALPYNTVILAKNPRIFWPLSDLVGPVVTDLSGNGINGVYTPPVVLGGPGLVTDGSTAMKVNNAVAGASLFAPIGAGAGASSIEVWVEANAPFAGVQEIGLAALDFVGVNGLIIGLSATFNILSWNAYQGGVPTALVAPTPVVAGTIYHMVAAFDGVTTVKCYLNAALIGTIPVNVSGAWTYFGTFFDLTANPANGIAQKAVGYGYELTPADVLSNYQAGIA